jgi:hypothetical protein
MVFGEPGTRNFMTSKLVVGKYLFCMSSNGRMKSVTYGRKCLKRRSHEPIPPESSPILSTPIQARKRPKVVDQSSDHFTLISKGINQHIVRDLHRYAEFFGGNQSPSPTLNLPNQSRPGLVRRSSLPINRGKSIFAIALERDQHFTIIDNFIFCQIPDIPGELTQDHSSLASTSNSLTRSSTLHDLRHPANASSPSTPRKPARDLSQIFNLSPSSDSLPVTPKNTKIAKRMLHRAHTDSSASGGSASIPQVSSIPGQLHARSPSDSNRESTSRLTTPTKEPGKLVRDESSLPLGIAHHASATGHAFTYAGKSRSFLVEIPTHKLGSLGEDSPQRENMEVHDDGFEIRESYTDLRSRWGVDNSEEDPRPTDPLSRNATGKRKGKTATATPLPDGMANNLKSISELRNKGERRRFFDEVGYLFEGMDPTGPISLRRAGYFNSTSAGLYVCEDLIHILVSQCLGNCHKALRS